MAGTRLLLQSIVLIELIIIVWISIQYGFCYHTSSSQGTSPTTKDIPRLIFLTDNNSDDPKMNQEWWEESLCHPINSILISKYFDFEGDDHNDEVEVVEESEENDNNDIIDLSLFEQFYRNTKITLVLENVTQLTYWVDYFTNELSELLVTQLDGNTDDDDNTDNNTDYDNNNFRMDLEIIRPAAPLLEEEEEKDQDQDQLLWENYLNQKSITNTNTNTADQKQHYLVIYVPSNLLLLLQVLDETPPPSWKSIEEGNVDANPDVNPSKTTMTKMTMIVPALSLFPSSSSSSSLKSLIESWMIRSTIDIDRHNSIGSSSSSHKTSSNKNRKKRKSSSAKKRKKLVRNFPFEHFLAVLMPLLFPLLFPFLISWIKEYLRYKNMNKLKQEDKDKKSNAEEENTNTNTNKLKDKDQKKLNKASASVAAISSALINSNSKSKSTTRLIVDKKRN